MTYRDYELNLLPGAKLFVYTDGAPETANIEEEFYGIDRLLDALNECAEGTPEMILQHIRKSVDDFAGDGEQFDDLTMLCLEYRCLSPQ